MTDSDRRRRDVLRAGAGLGATALLGGLGGCLSSVPGVGGDGGGGRPGYARWLPTRGTLGAGDDGEYRFITLDAGTIRDNRSRFSTDTYGTLTDGFGDEGLLPGFDAIDAAVSVQVDRSSTSFALEGSFSVDDVVASLQDRGFTEEESHAGYTIYTGMGVSAVGVTDGTMVFGASQSDPAGTVAEVVDVGEGDADGLVDVSDDADALVSTLGEGAFANGRIPAGGISGDLQTDPLVANGLRGRLSGDTVGVRQVLVYESEGSVDPAAARDASGTAAELDGASASQSGRTALVEGSVATADLSGDDVIGVSLAGTGEIPGEETRVPQATFQFDYDPDAGSVSITHQGGDTFNENNTAALRYGAQGDRREWPLPVSAGDEVTVEGGLSSGDDVVVVWSAPDADRTAVVGQYRVP